MNRIHLTVIVLLMMLNSAVSNASDDILLNAKRGYSTLTGQISEQGILIKGDGGCIELPCEKKVSECNINLDFYPDKSFVQGLRTEKNKNFTLTFMSNDENSVRLEIEMRPYSENYYCDYDSIILRLATQGVFNQTSLPNKEGRALCNLRIEIRYKDGMFIAKVGNSPDKDVRINSPMQGIEKLLISADSNTGVILKRMSLGIEKDESTYMTEWEDIDKLNQRFERTTDKLEGIWRVYDSVMEEDLLRLGGEYRLAIVKDGNDYKLIYLDGGKINSDRWKRGMLKGVLKSTDFNSVFDTEWIDAEFKPMKHNIKAQVEDMSSLITMTFPYQNSKIRLRKSGIKMESSPITKRTVLWSPGDYGSKFYRIPGICKSSDGVLVAVADKRIESISDLPGKIDVVCRISKDNGKTWSEPKTLASNDSGGGYGDPLLIADRKSGDILCIFTHGNGLWQSTADNNGKVMMIRSKDNGMSWSQPINISNDFFTSDTLYKKDDKIKGITLFASSGSGLQLKNGRLMFVVVVRPHGQKKELASYAVYSDDGGYNWKCSPMAADNDGDEAKMVEQSDGKIRMSIRNSKGGFRKFSFSEDGGVHWSVPVFSSTLPDPGCNGDIISYQTDDGKNVLIHSIPADSRHRRNVSLYSEKGDDQWTRLVTIVPGSSGYSSICDLGNGKIGVLVEEKVVAGTYSLVYYEIDMKKI